MPCNVEWCRRAQGEGLVYLHVVLWTPTHLDISFLQTVNHCQNIEGNDIAINCPLSQTAQYTLPVWPFPSFSTSFTCDRSCWFFWSSPVGSVQSNGALILHLTEKVRIFFWWGFNNWRCPRFPTMFQESECSLYYLRTHSNSSIHHWKTNFSKQHIDFHSMRRSLYGFLMEHRNFLCSTNYDFLWERCLVSLLCVSRLASTSPFMTQAIWATVLRTLYIE